MKLLIVALTLLSANAFATAVVSPILEKSVSPGFSPVEYKTGLRCRIYSDRVEIETHAGVLTATRVVPVLLAGDVNKLILQAEQGTLTKKPAPTDGPIVKYTGTLSDADGGPRVIMLKSLGSKVLENDAKAVVTLVNFIDQLCK